MPENQPNTDIAKSKRSRRKALASPIQSNSNRNEINIKGKISSTPKSVNSPEFPLYKPFVLSNESDELYIKVTKNTIISLSTSDRYNSSVSGYLVIL